MDFESCREKPFSSVASLSCPGVLVWLCGLQQLQRSESCLSLAVRSYFVPFSLCLPSSLLHSSQHSPCIHPNQKQLFCGKSIQNPEYAYGEGDEEKQSEDCWLGASSPTLQRRKWHFSAFQNSMTTFEFPNATVHM